MDSLIERYLWEIERRCRRKLSSAQCEDLTRELRGHLSLAAADLESQGMSSSEAAKLACVQLGSERVVASRLIRAHTSDAKPWWRVASVCLILPFIAALAPFMPLNYHRAELLLVLAFLVPLGLFVIAAKTRRWIALPAAASILVAWTFVLPNGVSHLKDGQMARAEAIKGQSLKRIQLVDQVKLNGAPKVEGGFIALAKGEAPVALRKVMFMPYRLSGAFRPVIFETLVRDRDAAQKSWAQFGASYVDQLRTDLSGSGFSSQADPLWLDEQETMVIAGRSPVEVVYWILALGVLNALALGVGKLADQRFAKGGIIAR